MVHPAPVLPLQRYALFHSRDVDEARESVARIFCPHLLAPVTPRRPLDACHHSAPLHKDVSLNYVQYGPCVDIQPGYLKDFFLLQIPLHGGAEVRCGGQSVRADVHTASLPSPTEPLSMRWADDSPHLIVKLSRVALQTQLERLAQASIGQPLVFDLGVRLSDPALAPVLHFIRCLRDTLDAGDSLTGSLLAEQAEAYLMSSLLLCVPHNHGAALDGGGARRALVPRTVRRAQEYMASRLDQAVSLADLCQHLGVSARALQSAFRQHTGESPTAFMRNARLDRLRDELRAASQQGGVQGGMQVGDLATRYGFMHAGRLAADYRARFGESPSQTLRTRHH
ncbi:MAG: AraC family transcriptional regulator [Variovorax sp.]|nr:AraC family transcriptional regulator [Variovorax sp.]